MAKQLANITGNSLASRLQRLSLLPSGYIETSPNNFRFDQDVLRYANRWGTATVTLNGFTAAEADILLSQYASSVNLNGKSAGCSIEITNINFGTSANTAFFPFIFMHSLAGASLTVKLEVLKAGAPTTWETAYDGSIVDYVIAEYTSGSGNLIGVRWTFSAFTAATNYYIRYLGCIGRNADAYAWNIMKGGDTMYGNFVLKSNLTSGATNETALHVSPLTQAGSPAGRNFFKAESLYNAGVNGHSFYLKSNTSNQFELLTDWSTALRLGVITNAGNAATATAAKYLNLTTAAITWDGNALLDAGNYTTYTVTKTGGGASGSWGINITGSAATITGVYGGTLTSGQVTTALGFTPQTALTLTTTGTSGAATLVGGTLNIPNYASGGGSGTVTSVALSLPSIFSVSGSPVTGAGTLTAALASQSANLVWAAPNGSAGAPTFRALVAADIPTLNQNTTGSAGSVAWSGITSKPTTISGFGITDTVTQAITGYTAGTNTALAATDTIIAAFGKVQGQLNAKGAGTVTSVGLSLPALFTVTNSPVTGSGTLTGAFASQTANTVLAAPNGTAGAPTMRALVEADIPTLSQAKITNLTTDLAAKAPLASPTFTGTPVLTTTTTVGASGPVVGYRDIPLTVSNTSITFALADAGKGFGKDDTNPYTYNIPANSTTAFPVGTAITVFNNNDTGNVTIAIVTDTLRLGGTTTTGSRTLAPFGVCTLLKVASTVWIASGAGLT